tara:strand:- start:413 stop:1186 length:774 start_codon:yes stop_codon:yes gene_type:complete
MQNNNDILLDLAKNTAVSAGAMLPNSESKEKKFVFDKSNTKEVKAEADLLVESFIINKLRSSGIPILSEERGFLAGNASECRRWIIDPIDGTFNYVKGLGACAVSIALWESNTPIFGVIFSIDTGKIYWGGRELGAFCDDVPIFVSKVTDMAMASVCTGFPVRLEMSLKNTSDEFWSNIKGFSKVRMIGCASMSLINVAKASSELYFENQIMIWDIAAGLAIVEGAGGVFSLVKGKSPNSYNVVASNNSVVSELILS